MNANLASSFLNLLKTAQKRKTILKTEEIYDKLHDAIHSDSLQVNKIIKQEIVHILRHA
jgi:hypothetical protein